MIEKNYFELLNNIKKEIEITQKDIVISANKRLIQLYFRIGNMINENMELTTNFVDDLAKDLKITFPNINGFSRRNLFYMKKLAIAYDKDFIDEVISKICWTNNKWLLTKINDDETRKWYAVQSVENGWTEGVLLNQIGTALHLRQMDNEHKTTNYLQKLDSDISKNVLDILKDPYLFNFLNYNKDMNERDIENILVNNITKLLLELGRGFAFIGNQYHLEVGEDDFYIDLLFYNTILRCYVVIELKTTKFIPEYTGKLNFYLSAVDSSLKTENDNPTIGILLCKNKNKLTAEFALKDVDKPIGVAEYKYMQEIPEYLQSMLPNIESIENRINFFEENDEKN